MKPIRLILILVLVLALFTGCGSLDRAEDMAEDKLDAAEDFVEQKVSDAANALKNPAPEAAVQEQAPADPSRLITPEEAESIALEHAGIPAEEAVGLHTALEMDDGRQEYEVDFHYGHLEYEYEIDALTGQILSYDMDD